RCPSLHLPHWCPSPCSTSSSTLLRRGGGRRSPGRVGGYGRAFGWARWLLFVGWLSSQDRSAVDADRLAGDVRGSRAAEVGDGGPHVRRLAEAAGGDPVEVGL